MLSLLLFSIYTDTIRSSVASVKILKYADDTVLLGNISVHDDFENYCDEISRICAVCTDHELLLNTSKTKAIVLPLVEKHLMNHSCLLAIILCCQVKVSNIWM